MFSLLEKNAKLNFLFQDVFVKIFLKYLIISKRKYYHSLFLSVFTLCMLMCWYNDKYGGELGENSVN